MCFWDGGRGHLLILEILDTHCQPLQSTTSSPALHTRSGLLVALKRKATLLHMAPRAFHTWAPASLSRPSRPHPPPPSPWLTPLVRDVSLFPSGARPLSGRPVSTCDPHVYRSCSDAFSSCLAPGAVTGVPPGVSTVLPAQPPQCPCSVRS